jgi:hypothetical protein
LAVLRVLRVRREGHSPRIARDPGIEIRIDEAFKARTIAGPGLTTPALSPNYSVKPENQPDKYDPFRSHRCFLSLLMS